MTTSNRGDGKDILLDVSRLIWRAWAGRLPTGIDRVCIAYLDHIQDRARAMVQHKGRRIVLSPRASHRLFGLLRQGRSAPRSEWLRVLLGLIPAAARSAIPPGALYLNVGHTGLDEPSLPSWIAQHQLRAVYLIHDLIPISHPEYCRDGEAARHSRRMNHALSSAHGIIGNSQATLDELSRFAQQEGRSMPPTIAALISGHDPLPSVAPRDAGRPYFVTLGTIEGRKNHLLLLQLWQRLIVEMGEQAPMLVIIGQRGWEAGPALSMIDRLPGLGRHVLELGSCADGELAEWIAGARALLMPSFAEGFGLPIIEALQLGTPVIASDLMVYREIAGDIPLYIDPLDGMGWQRAVRDMIGESAERKRQTDAISAYQAPSWDRHFAIVEEWLETL